MIEITLTRGAARRVYNRLGAALDRAERYEARAKALALDLLRLEPGQRVLHAGVGTGIEHAAIAAAIGPAGLLVGIDLARRMLDLTRQRAASPLVEGDAATLPLADHSFDRIYSAYMLDLLPRAGIIATLSEFRRVLAPGGLAALVSLTEGVDPASQAFVTLWKLGYRINPTRFGGCRPLQLQGLVEQAGLQIAQRATVIQRGFPSEVVLARA